MGRPGYATGICSKGQCYMPNLCEGTPEGCLMQPKEYYPLFMDLNDRLCVVIGGGLIAQRKVSTLLEYGAKVHVISPEATATLKKYAASHKITYTPRTFRSGDLDGAWLVYAATDDTKINQAVYSEATQKRIFANVVDQKPLCSFIVPAIAKRQPITVAISTGGISPSLAKLLKEEIEALIGPAYAKMANLLRSLRGIAKQRLPRYNDRKRFFGELTQGEVFRLVRKGQVSQARRKARTLLKAYEEQTGGKDKRRHPK